MTDIVAINGVVVTKEMIEEGNEIAGYLMDACIEKALGGDKIGGCKEFDIDSYPPKYHQLILRYLDESIDSVTAIYMAMEFIYRKKPIAKVEPMEDL